MPDEIKLIATIGINSFRIPEGEDLVNVLTISDVKSSGIQDKFTERKVALKKVHKYLAQKGDIVIRNTGDNEVLYINKDNILITDIAIKIECDSLSKNELFYLLNRPHFKKYLRTNSEGSALKKISVKMLENYRVDDFNPKGSEIYFNTLQLKNIKKIELEKINLMINHIENYDWKK